MVVMHVHDRVLVIFFSRKNQNFGPTLCLTCKYRFQVIRRCLNLKGIQKVPRHGTFLECYLHHLHRCEER